MIRMVDKFRSMGINLDDLCKIFHIMLSRGNVIIVGRDEEVVNDTVHGLKRLLPHRICLDYGVDIVSEEEANELDNDGDTESRRAHVFCYTQSSYLALLNVEKFQSWVLGFLDYKGDSQRIIEEILNRSSVPTCVLHLGGKKKVEFLKGPPKSIKFEKRLLEDTIKNARRISEKILRIIKKRLYNFEKNALLEEVLNFEEAEDTIGYDLFKFKMEEYMNAARRVFILLSKLKLLTILSNAEIKISKKMIRDSIGDVDISVDEVIRMIKDEWGEDFTDILSSERATVLGDWIESLWV
ncbi:MAG: hypothetical protein ACTSVF_02815 [Candidatus Asgardarchaeia archaeon]